MKPRIALATYEGAPDLAPDDQLLLPALAAARIEGVPAVWSSEDVSWETFDGVIIRSCWDYHRRAADFQAWLERLDASRLPVWNAIALVQWNVNKRYLVDLETRGVPTIPTYLVRRGSVADIESVLIANRWMKFVIKPAISASGFETHAITIPLSDAARSAMDRVIATGDALLQPFVEEVPTGGELSLVFIDGEFSHAAIKRAKAGEFRVQVEHGGSVHAIDASPAVIEQAARVLRSLPEVPLYARVDGVTRGDEFLLMELELIEPNLFFDTSPNSAARFATAIAQRLRNA